MGFGHREVSHNFCQLVSHLMKCNLEVSGLTHRSLMVDKMFWRTKNEPNRLDVCLNSSLDNGLTLSFRTLSITRRFESLERLL